ncbi:protein kinase domain-containing protein [Nostoc sp. CCY0012]|uniref:protein kinase domain-containing protein n=1 Tax=Nostoc sp. CCY0012 TaxID=1056123 RepID=UPI0039C6B6AE
MGYCINPLCPQRHNPDDAENCLSCGNPLLINGRIRLLRPLRSLSENPYAYTDVFEVEDFDVNLHLEPRIRIMKVLRWSDDFKLVELLQRESLVLQLLDHPGIPKSSRDDYFTFTLNDGLLELHCLVIEKIEGENLAQWVKSYGRITSKLAYDWLLQLIDILDLVHRSGFFHRDIKPENIICQPNGKLALIDFGGAREITRSYLMKVSTSGGLDTGIGGGHEITAIRTACYSPLEQINGQAVPQSDFYALGRTLVYSVTGISLLEIKSDERTGRLLWRDKAPHIDKYLADFIDYLIAPFPGQRPQNTQIIIQRLERLPIQSKIHRIIDSNPFRVLAASLIVLVFVWGYKGYSLARSNYYFGQGSRHLNEPEIAKKYYKLAVKYNPKDIDAYNNLALACQQLRDVQCVNDTYEKVFKLKPNNWVLHYNLGNFYDDQGKYDEAEKQYKLAIQHSNNKAANAVSNLARLKNLQEKYSEAAELVLQGLNSTQNPEWEAGLYKNLGWARLKQRRYVEAEDYLQKSVKLDSQRVDAYCLLADTYERLGNFSKAGIYWQICLTARSSLPEVQEWKQQKLQQIFREN